MLKAKKKVIEMYKHRNSPVYVSYLDASKAFDRINHWSLFAKLNKRNVNTVFVRLLIYWYTKQIFCTRWGSCISRFFQVTNGVRQGGILSPALFNMYMDDLSTVLNNTFIGCSINGVLCNHLMYADDTCIITPSPSAMYKLLKICTKFAEDNSIIFNSSKSKLMCFKPKSLKSLYVPDMYFNDKILEFRKVYIILTVVSKEVTHVLNLSISI